MPIVRGNIDGGVIVVPPGETPDGPEEVFRPVIPEAGTYVPEWLAPNGTVLQLNPETYPTYVERFSLKTVAGLGVAPLDLLTTPAPGGGVTVDSTQLKARMISWPLRIRSDTHLGFLTEWRRVAGLFAQTRRLGPGRLRITRPSGSDSREILAHYAGGFELEPDDGAWLRATPVVSLLCPDPLWRAINPTTYSRSQEANADYLTPYPTIGSGAVIGATTFLNAGVEDAWPTWTIRGPMTQLVATNVTRGQSFTLTYALAAGQTITIQSQPIRVIGPAGQNLLGAMNTLAGGKPWRLDAEALSSVQFTVTGSAAESAPGADDGTKITVSFYEKYETA